jgi:DNA invertase Pin-like site-specific DNA recombinase
MNGTKKYQPIDPAQVLAIISEKYGRQYRAKKRLPALRKEIENSTFTRGYYRKHAQTANKIIGYARVSTCRQGYGVALDEQKLLIHKWTVDNGCEFIKGYIDKGKSGKRLKNRHNFKKALDHAIAIQGILVVTNITRFSRPPHQIRKIARRLKRQGAYLVCIEDHYDTRKERPGSLRTIMEKYDLYHDKVSKRSKKIIEQRIKFGQRFSRYASYGYDYSPDGDDSLGRNEKEQKVIRWMLYLHDKGKKTAEIVRMLNHNKIPTKQKKGPWQQKVVAAILKRERAQEESIASCRVG